MPLKDEILAALAKVDGRPGHTLVLNPADAALLNDEVEKLAQLAFTPNRLQAFLGSDVVADSRMPRGRVGIRWKAAENEGPDPRRGADGRDGVIVLEEYEEPKHGLWDRLEAGDD